MATTDDDAKSILLFTALVLVLSESVQNNHIASDTLLKVHLSRDPFFSKQS